MFKNIFGSIDGIGIYPVFGLIIFFVAFMFVLIRIFRMKKDEIHHLENLPFEKPFENYLDGGRKS